MNLNHLKYKKIKTDILIIGSGGAGLRAAIEVAKNDVQVLVVTKGIFGKCGATVTAGMFMDAPSSRIKEICGIPGVREDTEESFCKDMFEEGKYINSEELVWTHCSNAAKYIKELVDWGIKIDGLNQSPGHRYPRSLISNGRSLMQTLIKQFKKYNIKYLENTMITNLLTANKQIVGAVGIELISGDFLVINAKAVILATGGAMRIYPIVTAPQELVGDGMFMAFEVGAKLTDMEFPLFLPACLYWPESMKGLNLPYTISSEVGGWWLNAFGERFIKKWDPQRMEAGTTRDVASIAQAVEIIEGRCSPHGGIYVSFKHLPNELLSAYIEKDPILKNFKYGGFSLLNFDMDPREVAYEAGPAAHYWNGGIKINKKCETNIIGLYAAGEVQGGTMGANRLAGNAITECIVFGALSGKNASQFIKKKNFSFSKIDNNQLKKYYEKLYQPLLLKEGIAVNHIRKKLQEMAFKYIGPIRTGSELQKCLEEIKRIRKDIPYVATICKERTYNREWIEALELNPMISLLEIVARSSLMREESRGAMYRKDFPNTDNKDWLSNIIVYKNKDKLDFMKSPIMTSFIQTPKPERIPYMIPKWEFSRRH